MRAHVTLRAATPARAAAPARAGRRMSAMRAHVTLRAATPARAAAPARAGRRMSAMRADAAPTRATSARVAYGNASTTTLKLDARGATRRTTLGGGRRRFETRAMFEVRATRPRGRGTRACILMRRGRGASGEGRRGRGRGTDETMASIDARAAVHGEGHQGGDVGAGGGAAIGAQLRRDRTGEWREY